MNGLIEKLILMVKIKLEKMEGRHKQLGVEERKELWMTKKEAIHENRYVVMRKFEMIKTN